MSDTETVARRRLARVRIHGHQTSVRLEPVFEGHIRAIAARHGTTLSRLVERIDAARGSDSLTAAIRVFVAVYLAELAGADGRAAR